jgi:four helix bundle protein
MKPASQRVSKSASQPHPQPEGNAPRTRHFRDLIAWQKAMALAKSVYAASDAMPTREQFGMTSQMRRSAVSVPSNIAEGHGRTTDRGFVVFLAQARGSLYELQTQIQLAADLRFLPPDKCKSLLVQGEEVARLLNGLLKAAKG